MYTRFYFKNPHGSDEGHIQIVLKLSKGEYYTVYLPGEKIREKYWSRKSQRSKSTNPEHHSINEFLDYIEREVNAIRRRLDMSGLLSKTEAKRAIDDLLNKREDPFWEMWDQYIKEKEHVNTATDRNKLHRKYIITRDKLKLFNSSLKFRDITLDTCNRFADYLFTEHKLSINTVAKYLSRIKSFMNDMKRRGYHSTDSYNQYTIKKAVTRHPYFTNEELELLHNHRDEDDKYENCRLNILLGCYSGQRYGDWHQITPESAVKVQNQWFYYIVQQKTGEEVYIPSYDLLKEIVDLRPRSITNQKMNIYLKELCRKIGIDSLFISNSTAGNKKRVLTRKKCDVVSTHIGRRTFISNALLSNRLTADKIMKVTGHKKYETFKKYIQLSSTDGMEEFQNIYQYLDK